MNQLEPLLALLLTPFLAVIVHEAGHVVAARLCGVTVTSVGAGTGWPLLRLRLGEMRVYVCSEHILRGCTLLRFPDYSISKRRRIIVFAGGIAANALFALFALASILVWPGHFAAAITVCLINALAITVDAFPNTSLRGHFTSSNDGGKIQSTIRERQEAQAPDAAIKMRARSADHLRRIGDHVGQASHAILAVNGYLDYGDTSSAWETISRVPDLPPAKYPQMAGQIARLRGTCALAIGDPASALRYFGEAESISRSVDCTASILEAECGAACALLAADRAEDANTVIQRLTCGGSFRDEPAIYVQLLVARLQYAARNNDLAAAKQLYIELEELRKSRSVAQTLSINHTMAELYVRCNEPREAAWYYLTAAMVVGLRYRLLVDQDFCEAYAARYADLITDARVCIQESGYDFPAECTLVRPAVEVAEKPIVSKMLRRTTLACLAWAALSTGVCTFFAFRPANSWMDSAVTQTYWSLSLFATILGSGIYILFGKRRHSQLEHGVIIVMSVLPLVVAAAMKWAVTV